MPIRLDCGNVRFGRERGVKHIVERLGHGGWDRNLTSGGEQDQALDHLRVLRGNGPRQPVAAQFWTVEAGTAFIHKLAYVEEAKPLSPGTTLTAALMEQVIDRDGVTLVDFGTGDDPYKRDWMEVQRPRYALAAMNPADPRQWPALGKLLLRRLAGRGGAG